MENSGEVREISTQVRIHRILDNRSVRFLSNDEKILLLNDVATIDSSLSLDIDWRISSCRELCRESAQSPIFFFVFFLVTYTHPLTYTHIFTYIYIDRIYLFVNLFVYAYVYV